MTIEEFMSENELKAVQAGNGEWYIIDREGHNALDGEMFATETAAIEGYEVTAIENGWLQG